MYLIHSAICTDHQPLIIKYNQRNDCQNPLVGIPIKSNNSSLKEFTFCGKFNFRFLRESILMGFDKKTYLWWMMNYDEKMGALKVHGKYVFFYYKTQRIRPDQWQHFCISVSSSQVKIVLNGEILRNVTKDFSSKEIAKDRIWIGGVEGNSWHLKQRFEGEMTDIHLWNKSLEFHHLTSITSNEKFNNNVPSPDLFTWITFEMQSNNNTSCVEYMRLKENAELYLKESKKNVLIEYFTDFNSSNYLCQAFGGELLVPKDEQELKEVNSYILKSEKCTYAFLGLKKYNETMVMDLRGEPTSFIKWDENQPNGEKYQQCISVFDAAFDDTRCFAKTCFLCNIKSNSLFTLRGNLSEPIEREYFVDMTKNQTKIRGLLNTECFWKDTWNFGQGLKLDESTSNMPPVGVRKWNDGKFLKFTKCNESEFTCHTYGHCIHRSKRCDGHPDCPVDGSDENECKKMTLAKGYDKMYPSVMNTTVFIYVEVLDVLDVNELEMDYTIEINVMLKWFDSRINFRNLKPRHNENQLDTLDFQKIWTPVLLLLHSNQYHIRAGEHKEGADGTVRVHQEGSPQQNDLLELDEDYLYPGVENPISMSNYFVVKLGCKFDLLWYIL